MVRMFSERRCARTVPRAGPVAVQANLIRGLSQLRIVLRAVHIMAVKASDPAAVHHALCKIISLHAVLVCRTIRKMRETKLAERVILELPVISQM